MLTGTQEAPVVVTNFLQHSLNAQMAAEVLQGLIARQKYIPSKYFYDARGSSLFERICRLPEYYLTRTELVLLKRFSNDLLADFENGDLVELGSGANWKIRTLLDAMNSERRSRIRYMPVDVSEAALVSASEELMKVYPELSVTPLAADFTRDLHRIPANGRKIVLLFGSTIGNLNEEETRTFLTSLRRRLGPDDRFLIGLDMVKPVEILEAAYNDSREVTAEFNKNILLVINAQLAANFHPDAFDHVAFFNESKEQVEMHLRARREMQVLMRGVGISIHIERGETIRTEICRKFRRERVAAMMLDAGLTVSRWFSDSSNWFSIAEIVRN